jgi:iron-sulfur cluster repair protein YtfE (RIC family)
MHRVQFALQAHLKQESSLMATELSKQTASELTRLEHEQIRERLKVLHRMLAARTAPLEEVDRLFHEFRTILSQHFSNEERDGFFDQIVARAPQLSRQADSLTHEHADMLGQLDAILAGVQRGTGRPLCWQTLALRFETFMKRLMHHESEENGMLQQAYVDDLGTKD